jgi:anti-sigma factor RsiW
MSCNIADEKLLEFSQVLLSRSEQRELKKHIARCPECQQRLTQLQTIESALATAPSLPAISHKRLEEIQSRAHSLIATEAGWLAYGKGEIAVLEKRTQDASASPDGCSASQPQAGRAAGVRDAAQRSFLRIVSDGHD